MVKCSKIGLASLLDAADLRQRVDDGKRGSHSLRLFYIFQQIREGVIPHMLIRNTGTSGKLVYALTPQNPADGRDKETLAGLEEESVVEGEGGMVEGRDCCLSLSHMFSNE